MLISQNDRNAVLSHLDSMAAAAGLTGLRNAKRKLVAQADEIERERAASLVRAHVVELRDTIHRTSGTRLSYPLTIEGNLFPTRVNQRRPRVIVEGPEATSGVLQSVDRLHKKTRQWERNAPTKVSTAFASALLAESELDERTGAPRGQIRHATISGSCGKVLSWDGTAWVRTEIGRPFHAQPEDDGPTLTDSSDDDTTALATALGSDPAEDTGTDNE